MIIGSLYLGEAVYIDGATGSMVWPSPIQRVRVMDESETEPVELSVTLVCYGEPGEPVNPTAEVTLTYPGNDVEAERLTVFLFGDDPPFGLRQYVRNISVRPRIAGVGWLQVAILDRTHRVPVEYGQPAVDASQPDSGLELPG